MNNNDELLEQLLDRVESAKAKIRENGDGADTFLQSLLMLSILQDAGDNPSENLVKAAKSTLKEEEKLDE